MTSTRSTIPAAKNEWGNLVVLLNAFQKKSQKLPKQEIERAKRLQNQYYDEK